MYVHVPYNLIIETILWSESNVSTMWHVYNICYFMARNDVYSRPKNGEPD